MNEDEKERVRDRANVEPLGRQWHGDVDAQLPPEMDNRPDARELRDFMRAFLAIDDPADRQRIIEAVESART